MLRPLSLFLLVASVSAGQLPVVLPQGDSPAAAAPTPLDFAQLVARPELWPRSCTMAQGGRLGEVDLVAGSSQRIQELTPQGVMIDLPEGQRGLLPHEATDVLPAVNAWFATLTPAQRALDSAGIAKAGRLLPKTVVLQRRLTFGEEPMALVIEPGTELALGSFDGTSQLLRHDGKNLPPQPLFSTDLAERARAALLAKEPAPHRLLTELAGKLVSARDGKPVAIDAAQPPDYLLLYFSASWCPHCREFTPDLVRFHGDHRGDVGKRFDVIWVSDDHTAGALRDYAVKAAMPWAAVAFDQLAMVPCTRAHAGPGVPDLVIVDRSGALVADCYDGEQYQKPELVLKEFAARLYPPKK